MSSDASRLRDSTQIVLPCAELDDLEGSITDQFTVTVVSEDGRCRIIGSPVQIKEASGYLTRRGVSLP